MKKIESLITATLLLFWGFCSYHFGMGQLLDYPRWEHYVVEGYFLLSAAVLTWIWFKIRGSG